jgi:8-oxo-dGTP pyrophosphatase MutT (NUDIX family)
MMRPRDGVPTGRLARLKERLSHPHPITADDSSLIWAAVTVVITPAPDSILLIRRADREGDPWSGHMALPGGRREPADQDLLATAIREAHEEVGLGLGPEHLLGSLEDVVPRTPVLPPVAVRPFVFLTPERAPLVLNREVASATWVPLDDLLRPERHHAVWLEVAGESRQVQAYQLENAVVWGMTERILTSLIRRLKE